MRNEKRGTKKWTAMLAALLIIHVTCLTYSCTSVDCPVENKVYTVYNLLKANGSTDTLKVDTLSIITKRANDTDTILLNRLTGISTFDLPISYTLPEDIFYLTLLDTIGHTYQDTIFIKKENYPHFESVDCQATYFHRLTEVRTTKHIIDSIVINNPTVNYDAKNEHFHIYFKARY